MIETRGGGILAVVGRIGKGASRGLFGLSSLNDTQTNFYTVIGLADGRRVVVYAIDRKAKTVHPTDVKPTRGVFISPQNGGIDF